ncbi:MAG: hypothetical protein ISP61_02730 [Flavobacteriaceae bacterium]|nr:hypothetical protein [Flavobacteriaceae bacterium]
MNQLLRIHAIWNPHVYHGWGRSKRFFEGWYYKIVNESQTGAFAIIPGIAMDENGNKQSFIQVLDGINNSAKYYKFNADEFKPTPRRHSLKIGNNYFSRNEISLDLPFLKGDLKFKNLSPWSNSFLSPGIMGPYSFIPFMECYHGIISMNHDISGSLKYNNGDISFKNGRGYMEKDWGHSFPKAYIWMQSNHFSKPNISIKSSIAIIPWMRSSFIGHIAGVLIGDKLIEFTTYNGTKVNKCEISIDKVKIEMENGSYLLRILAHREKATTLAAPIAGFMDGRIDESMRASIEVELLDKKKNIVLLKDIGESAGIEVAGKYELLIK